MTGPDALPESEDLPSVVGTPVEVRRIRAIEGELEPFDIQFDGWCAWAIVRPHAIGRLASLPSAPAARRSPRARLSSAVADVARLASAPRRRFLVKTYASGLAEPEGDRFRDVWFDDLADELGDVFKVEQINNPLFAERSERSVRRRDVTNEFLDGFLAGSLARVAGAPGAAAAATALRDRLRDVPELESLDERAMLRVISTFYWGVRLWGRLLSRVRPDAVLVADPSEIPLAAAARRCGIPLVELQHGLNDPAHHAAYAWAPAARPWKHRLPIPDRIFVYGDHWRERLSSGGFWDEELATVGSPRMDRHRLRATPRSSERALVAVTTQGLDVEPLVDFLARWLESLGDREDVELIVKLHPAAETDPTPYERRLGRDPRVRVVLGSQEPSTMALLAAANLHLSISSTCHYEALALGTPTAVLPFATHEIMLPLCRAGHATLLRSPDDLAALTARWRDLRVPSGVGDRYFSGGATAAMRRELAALGTRTGSLTHRGVG